ncbi:MAG: MutS-related protein [Anaerolineae bacterium]
MEFHSILSERLEESAGAQVSEAPDFFADLNLDQVIDAITEGKQQYNLKPFFFTPLRDTDTILYRHEVLRDLDREPLLETVRSFAERMIVVRRYLALADKLDHESHREGWFLEAADVYCGAVAELALGLSSADLRGRGFVAFRTYVADYVRSPAFEALKSEAARLKADLGAISYCLTIKGLTVKVRKYEGETDYSAEIENTFAKFKQGAAKDYRSMRYASSGMSYVEAGILDCVTRLYPDVFASLHAFSERHAQFLDETLNRFDREIQFYVAYLDFIAILERAGLRFCYPKLVETKHVYNHGGFDIALANRLVRENIPVVCNDFYLQGKERILVVSGPNQGGKTTFARTFGQLHYLASIGCPVPGTDAQLHLHDQLLTHFEKEEDIRNLRGKLQDDLVRIHAVLEQATPDSVLIINEMFSSTTLEDAIDLGNKIMARIVALDCLCVWVTFVDELASFSDTTVSMVSTVVPDNPALRTFKILRKPADGLAYALAIAEKHRVTYEHILERIRR